MRKCAYCDISQIKGCGRTFHKFPEKNVLAAKWVESIPLTDWTPQKGSMLCSDHFTEDCFETSSFRVRLKPKSIPTRFGDSPTACVCCKRKFVRNSSQTFFRFPLERPHLLNLWLQEMNMPNWRPTETSRICSAHFNIWDLRNVQGKYWSLKDHSIPTLFKCLDVPEGISQENGEPPLETPITPSTSQNPLRIVPLNNLLESVESSHSFDISFETIKIEQQIDHDLSDNVPADVASTNAYTMHTTQSYSTPNYQNCDRTIIDHDHSYDISPAALRQRLYMCQQQLKKQKKLLKLERRKCKRLRNRPPIYAVP